jgi:hypothetical protein
MTPPGACSPAGRSRGVLAGRGDQVPRCPFEGEGKKQLDRLHFPTRRISLEDFIEHLIVELRVPTKRGEEAALEVLAESRRTFEEEKRTKDF